jgi:hypothetical protein
MSNEAVDTSNQMLMASQLSQQPYYDGSQQQMYVNTPFSNQTIQSSVVEGDLSANLQNTSNQGQYMYQGNNAGNQQVLQSSTPMQYQQQSTIVAVKQLYSIDGFTKLTFSQILASSVFRIHFYPSTNINLAAGLQGSSVAQQYGNPNIVGVPTYIQG